VWFGCGGRLLGIWVSTWGQGFHCGASREVVVNGALARASAFRVGLGVLTSSSSLGISNLFCRTTQCM
jgi:hypothetical protein